MDPNGYATRAMDRIDTVLHHTHGRLARYCVPSLVSHKSNLWSGFKASIQQPTQQTVSFVVKGPIGETDRNRGAVKIPEMERTGVFGLALCLQFVAIPFVDSLPHTHAYMYTHLVLTPQQQTYPTGTSNTNNSNAHYWPNALARMRIPTTKTMPTALKCLLVLMTLCSQGIIQPVQGQLDMTVIKSLNIVSIGDSYIAGNGARDRNGNRDYFDDRCYRSNSNWVGRYRDCIQDTAPDLELFRIQVVNAACSGATLADVRSQNQLDSVTQNTDLVFLSISGNDVGFSNLLTPCYYLKLADICQALLDGAAGRLATIETEMTQLILDIRSRARTDTKVVLVGYPYMSLDTDFSLLDFGVPFSEEGFISSFPVAQRVRQFGDLLENSQIRAVNQANTMAGEPFAVFESTKALFAGREVDPRFGPGNPEGWVYELQPIETFGYFGENYHYNDLGHTGLGNHLCTTSMDYGAGQAILSEDGTAGGGSIDLAFVIDTTSSMADDIAAATAAANGILTDLQSRTTSLRVALVEYRDFGVFPGTITPTRLVVDFTESISTIQTALGNLVASGGAGPGEAVWSALTLAFSLGWRPGVRKLAIQFGDEPAYDPEPVTGLTTADVIEASLEVDPVIVSAFDSGAAGNQIRQVAEATGGLALSGSTADVAEGISSLLDSALEAPFAWLGTGYGGLTGNIVRFDGTGSFSRSGVLELYEWDVDNDGVYDGTTTEPYFEHVYTEDYNGLVTLRVTDDLSLVAFASAPVDVSADGDGIPADVDNCPFDFNPEQLDVDGNGIGDICDNTTSVMIGPIVNVLDPTFMGAVGTEIDIAANATDPVDGFPIVAGAPMIDVQWSVIGDGSGCTFADPSALSTVVSCPTAGTFVLRLTMTAADGLVGEDGAQLLITESVGGGGKGKSKSKSMKGKKGNTMKGKSKKSGKRGRV